jgi:hypothetical protein
MPEDTQQSAPKDLMGMLEYYLVTKAPFQLPDGVKEFIVKFGPWIDVVLLVLFLPVILGVFGLSLFLSPFAMLGGAGYTMWYWLGTIVLILQLVLQVIALPGLFARKMSGWTMVFYADVISLVYSLINGNILSGLVSALIGFYFLFQIKSKYTN